MLVNVVQKIYQVKELRAAMETRENLLEALDKARELSIHYAEKGDLLYPLLKLKYKFSGPSDVMWSVDDEILTSTSLNISKWAVFGYCFCLK